MRSGAPGGARPRGHGPLQIVLLDSWKRAPAEGSGTAVSISTLAEALRRRGHRVRPLAPGSSLPLTLRRLRYNVGLHGRVRAAEPDLVVGFDVDGFLLPAGRDYPLVVQLKGVAADEAHFDRPAARIHLRFLGLLEGRNARRADRVVVPSRYSARVAAEAYGLDPEGVVVVPEAVDPEPWRRLRERPPPRPDPRPTILSVARQYRRKNTRTLLRALPRVAADVPEVRLRVVGDGPELPRLRRQVREMGLGDRVELPGSVPETADLRREYFRADCFCLPSLQEGFGIAFLEAMAAGLPVVGGRAGAVPEVVPHGEAGLLVDPRDADALARALVRILTEPALAEELGRAGIERSRRFTPDGAARAFLDAVEDLVDPDPERAPSSWDRR